MKKTVLIFVLVTVFLSSFVFAQDNEVVLHLFYGQGCPHCGKTMEFLGSVEESYPNLVVEKHEIYFDDEERQLFENFAASYSTTIDGVPTIFIDDKFIVGFSDSIGEEIESEIQRCAQEECIDPITMVKDGNIVRKLTIPAVISAAIVDAINPCAFAVLIILVSTILVGQSRHRALFAGLAFSLSIFISYFLMGLGLYSAIQATEFTRIFFYIVAVLAIILGLFNLKDYFWYGKWFITEVPMSWRPKLKALIKSVTSVPGAFLIGFLVSLFLLPCTSGPYIVILGLLAEATTRSYAIILLLFYNLIFILPMILITLAVYLGFTTTEKAEELRQKKLKTLHLIAGIIILCLGIGMLIALWLGMI